MSAMTRYQRRWSKKNTFKLFLCWSHLDPQRSIFSAEKHWVGSTCTRWEGIFWVTWGGATWRIFFSAVFKRKSRLNTELSNMPGIDRCFRQCHLNIGLHITHRLSPIAPSPIPVPATDLGPFFEMRMRDLVLGTEKNLWPGWVTSNCRWG